MSSNQPDCAAVEETAHYALSSNQTVVGISTVQYFIEQKEHGKLSFGQLHNLTQARYFGIKARSPGLKRILYAYRSSNLERRQAQPSSTNRRARQCQHRVGSNRA